ncbi:MAG TPA: hypothetical protein VEH57_03365 [Thermoplasmata archaeon]|nr:hypothetical protein [Thermoplasmata archaeon]
MTTTTTTAPTAPSAAFEDPLEGAGGIVGGAPPLTGVVGLGFGPDALVGVAVMALPRLERGYYRISSRAPIVADVSRGADSVR